MRALRYYEEQVAWIRALLAAGLSGTTIRDLLPYFEARVSTPESRDRLRTERDRLDAHLAELAATRDRLDALVAAGDATGGRCTYLA